MCYPPRPDNGSLLGLKKKAGNIFPLSHNVASGVNFDIGLMKEICVKGAKNICVSLHVCVGFSLPHSYQWVVACSWRPTGTAELIAAKSTPNISSQEKRRQTLIS